MRPARSARDIVAAAITSGYAPMRRLVLYALALLFDDAAQVIPAHAQPSLTELAAITGMSRASVKRHLGALEHADPVRVRRDRPAVADARRYHARTSYTVLVTDRVGAPGAMAGLTLPRPHGSPGALARLTLPQRLGAHGATAEDDDMTTSAPWDDPAVIAVAADELARATGRPVDTDAAAFAVRQICEGRSVRQPVPYLRRAIREDARRWLPTPVPGAWRPPAGPGGLDRERIRAIIDQEGRQP